MPNKDTVKQWFETGDYPTQTQFYQKFDWLRWKDERIAAADLTDDLITIINSAATLVILPPGTVQWAAPAGTMLRGFYVKDSGAGQAVTFSAGTTPGGNEIWNNDGETFDTANAQEAILDKSFYVKNATTIYFTMAAVNTATLSINIYKQ